MLDDLDRSGVLALLLRRERAIIEREAQEAIRKKATDRINAADEQIGRCGSALTVFGIDLKDKRVLESVKKEYGADLARLIEEGDGDADEVPQVPSLPGATSTVREMVLDRVRAAGGNGVKAAEIRAFLESAHKMDIHEKTVGMTLYRLLKQRLVGRKGHIWFIAPQRAETVNPGVAAPGSEETAK
jgi:hypothetical protein